MVTVNLGQALRASPVTAEKALSLEAVKCFRPVSLEETSEPRQLVAKNSQTISPHTVGGKGCGRAASSLPPRLCPGPGTPNSWVTRRRSLFHSMHRSVFLLQVTDFGENTYYSNFIAHLNNIRYPGQSMVLSGLDILDMLPENVHHYYSYRGSLTTPPCTENVHWFVLVRHVPLSSAQIWKLENSVVDHQNKTLHNDYRRTQPLNNRVVETNLINLPNQVLARDSRRSKMLSNILMLP
ncbi:carbonic anhydrase 6 isoform X3 [Halichoerus grypus]